MTTAKKTATKTARKKAQPAAVAKAPKAPKATRAKKAPRFAQNTTSGLFLSKDTYKACIAGLMDQGIEHGDAVETLKVGLRQANGRPVPYELLGMAAANSPQASIAA